ncbi:MAG: hypothetical protein M1827_006940 [Pycnora praestabilis]|nr:MAG: hypothetical protein M1827_006940 [Pycnora praestabilis]
MISIISFVVLLGASVVSAQSFLNATGAYPQLSDFRQLLQNNSQLAAGLLSATSSGPQQTILVPSNDAFDTYIQQTGDGIGSLSSSDLQNIINYHSLQGALSSSDLQTPGGLVSNTALTDPMYANRELSSNGAKQNQVVYIQAMNTTIGASKIKIKRQLASDANETVKSGDGNTINLEPVNGKWDGGLFQIVDGFLTLPVNQTNTMTANNLNAFVTALNRTNVSIPTNAAPGLTCVCPNDEALDSLANSQGNLTDGLGSLLATVTRHGLHGSFYTTNFTDGDLIHSQNGYPILITRPKNGSIFLNDAMIISSDNIANTGCVHGLDRIMGFLNTTTNVTTPADAAIYSNASNIPTPTPLPSTSTALSSSSYTATATGSSTAGNPSATATASATSKKSEGGLVEPQRVVFSWFSAVVVGAGGLLWYL